MNQANPEPAVRPFTGKHILACMIAFFGVIISVNFLMAYLATGSWTGLVVKNSYVASQKFNQELSQAEAQRNSGFHSNATFENGKLSVQFNHGANAADTVDNVILWVGRPVSEHLDQTLMMTCASGPLCEVPLNLAPGLWSLQIRADVSGIAYRRDMRAEVSKQGNVRID